MKFQVFSRYSRCIPGGFKQKSARNTNTHSDLEVWTMTKHSVFDTAAGDAVAATATDDPYYGRIFNANGVPNLGEVAEEKKGMWRLQIYDTSEIVEQICTFLCNSVIQTQRWV